MNCSQIDWKKYFQLQFRDTNITLDFEKTDAEIIIKDKHYIFTVLYILSRTPLDIIGKMNDLNTLDFSFQNRCFLNYKILMSII